MHALQVELDTFPDAYALRPLGPGKRITERVSRWHTDVGEVAVKTFTQADRLRGMQEARLLAFLGAGAVDGRYRVQTLLLTEQGATSAEQDDHCVVVTRWEAGVQRDYDTYSTHEWSALGATLAALHRRLDQFDIPPVEILSARLRQVDANVELARLNPSDISLPAHPDIDEAWVRHYLSQCREMFTTCFPRALGNFPSSDPQRPIHNDYNQFNYLFDGSLAPVILDWEASIGAPREFEVVRCLNHLPLLSPALAQAFLAGYLGVRPLRAEDMAWAVDTSCLMHATKHWVLQGWIDGQPDFDQRLHGAMEMVSMLAQHRQRLSDFFTQCVEDAA